MSLKNNKYQHNIVVKVLPKKKTCQIKSEINSSWFVSKDENVC